MAGNVPQQIKDPIEPFEFCESELVIGLVCAVGTDYKPVQESIEVILRERGYAPNPIRVSDLIQRLTERNLPAGSEVERVSARMDAGNTACRDSGRKDLWALASIAEINKLRGADSASQTSLPRTAHLIFSLKRPEEVATLRKVYGDGFFLIGVFATEKERLDSLIEKNAPKQEAISLIQRDEDEIADEYGQHTRETFHLSDVFVQLKRGAYRNELSRFFSLAFSDPYETPTPQEHAMFLAYASSLRSSQLGRQVGAAITSKRGDLLAVGCNDVPKPGGGLYWPGPGDRRDHALGFDTNDRQRNKIADTLVSKLPESVGTSEKNALRNAFRGILDITEYGRAVHAEMDALLTCARSGVSPQGGVLYATTFPCHNCTRHIVAAGIERVFYIEPLREEPSRGVARGRDRSRRKGSEAQPGHKMASSVHTFRRCRSASIF
jgi:deoxycytidylate deaminase